MWTSSGHVRTAHCLQLNSWKERVGDWVPKVKAPPWPLAEIWSFSWAVLSPALGLFQKICSAEGFNKQVSQELMNHRVFLLTFFLLLSFFFIFILCLFLFFCLHCWCLLPFLLLFLLMLLSVYSSPYLISILICLLSCVYLLSLLCLFLLSCSVPSPLYMFPFYFLFSFLFSLSISVLNLLLVYFMVFSLPLYLSCLSLFLCRVLLICILDSCILLKYVCSFWRFLFSFFFFFLLSFFFFLLVFQVVPLVNCLPLMTCLQGWLCWWTPCKDIKTKKNKIQEATTKFLPGARVGP